MPGIVIACQCRLLSHNGVAHRFYPYEGEPSGKRCHRAPWCCRWLASRALGAHAHPRGRLRWPPPPRRLTWCCVPYEAHPAGPHLDTHQVDCQDQPMQEGETRHTLEKRHDGGTRIEALLLRPPRLQRRAGTSSTVAARRWETPRDCRSRYCSHNAACSRRSQRWWRSSLPRCADWMTVPTAPSFV